MPEAGHPSTLVAPFTTRLVDAAEPLRIRISATGDLNDETRTPWSISAALSTSPTGSGTAGASEASPGRVSRYQAGSSGTAMPVGLYSSGFPTSADSRLNRKG